MERVSLKADKREPSTKGEIRKLRLNGQIPAVLYGRKKEPVMLTVNEKELIKVTATKAGLNVLINLSVESEPQALVLIRDYQAHPIDRKFTHVDFQAVDVSEKIVVEVPIILIGVPIGVKEGGVLEQLLRKIEVKCLATKIPERLEFNVENLKIGDSVHSSRLKLPQDVQFAKTFEYTIATVVPPMKEEVAAPAAAAEAVPAEGAPPAPAPAAPGVAPAAEKTAAGAEKAPAPASKGQAKKEAGAPGAAPSAPAKADEKAKPPEKKK